MKYLKQRIKKFCDKTYGIVTLPDMDQCNGTWDNDLDEPHKCCFGARIAKAYNLKDMFFDAHGYMAGFNQMRQDLNLKPNELNSLLWICGAHFRPFEDLEWKCSPNEVMDNLMKVERKPKPYQFTFLLNMRIKLSNGCTITLEEKEKVQRIFNSIT